MIDILTKAGYTASSAGGVMTATQPLFIRTGRNQYRILIAPEWQP